MLVRNDGPPIDLNTTLWPTNCDHAWYLRTIHFYSIPAWLVDRFFSLSAKELTNKGIFIRFVCVPRTTMVGMHLKASKRIIDRNQSPSESPNLAFMKNQQHQWSRYRAMVTFTEVVWVFATRKGHKMNVGSFYADILVLRVSS
jgi:hypothetical protein